MNALSGRAIEGEVHLRQPIADILTTPPLGARRDYRSLLHELIDQPFSGAGRLSADGQMAYDRLIFLVLQ